jgi:c-di-GMP-binding flagellar brake protein YcgR
VDPSRTPLPDEVLLRSRMEITRVLDALHAEHASIVTYLDSGEILLVTRLLQVAPEAGNIVVDFSDSKAGNLELLSLKRIKFVCLHHTGRIEFLVANPREIMRDNRLALQLDFPESLVRLQRRKQPRVRVPEEAPVRCTLEVAPGLTVEGLLVDISVSGFGAILTGPDVQLDIGDVVRDVRIDPSRGKRIVADIEIRSCTAMMVKSRVMRRLVCRFLGADEDLESLMRTFIVDLSAT